MSRVRKNSKKLMWFNAESFVHAVGKELKVEIEKIGVDLKAKILNQLEKIDFKRNNLVRMADGSTTNDIMRATALKSSILMDPIKHEVGKALKTAVSAMRDNFEESHIGWYYEYGTGTEQFVPYPIDDFEGTPRNRAKSPTVGSPVVTRSRFINGGLWRDLGGNLRLSKAPRAGVTDENFLKYIDQETEAHFWFAEGVRLARNEFGSKIIAAIQRVPITDHIVLRKTFTIGED